MALQRRTLLQIVTGLAVGLSGCSGSLGTDTGTSPDSTAEQPSGSTAGESEPDDIHVVIHNHLPRSITASVELSTGQTAFVDDEVTIERDGFTSLDTGIDETGQYDAVVVVDDREREVPLTVEEYDLEAGSNVIFWIDEDVIRYGMED